MVCPSARTHRTYFNKRLPTLGRGVTAAKQTLHIPQPVLQRAFFHGPGVALIPIDSNFHVDLQGPADLIRPIHLFDDQLSQGLNFLLRSLQNQFIMNLQQQTRLQLGGLES